jgi:hypothetical protein
MGSKLLITPKSKVLEVIEAYPQLEKVLIDYVPAFEKLKNPLLRKTIGRIATLQQAATIGNVKVENLINHLRREVGQEILNDQTENLHYNTQKPKWFDENKIIKETDIRTMLQSGEQPVHIILSDLNTISSEQIYKVIAPFLPAPLIDKSLSLEIQHWIDKKSDELFYVYFYKIK